MELTEAIIRKMSELTCCRGIRCTDALNAKAQCLIDYFLNSYALLHLSTVYERDFSNDLFVAWAEYIDSEPNVNSATYPAYLLLSPETESGLGPFCRWLLNNRSDSDETIVMGAVLDNRVPAFVKAEYEAKRRKRELEGLNERYCRLYPKVSDRLIMAVRDLFVNEKVHRMVLYPCQLLNYYANPPRVGHSECLARMKENGIRHHPKVDDRPTVQYLEAYVNLWKSKGGYQECYNKGKRIAEELLADWTASISAEVGCDVLVS